MPLLIINVKLRILQVKSETYTQVADPLAVLMQEKSALRRKDNGAITYCTEGGGEKPALKRSLAQKHCN